MKRKCPFKIGDTVEVIDNSGGRYEYTNGEIGVVDYIDPHYNEYHKAYLVRSKGKLGGTFDFRFKKVEKENRMEKFEVGKKYKGKFSGRIIEVLFIGKEYAFCRYEDGREVNVNLACRDNWTDYKEPRTYKKWHTLRHHNGKTSLGTKPYDSREDAMKYDSEAIDAVLVEWREEV